MTTKDTVSKVYISKQPIVKVKGWDELEKRKNYINKVWGCG